jgi:hypothetical protein
VSYENYIAWRRLTHNGRLKSEQMSPRAQAEYEALGIRTVPWPTMSEEAQEAARRAYEALSE